MAISGAPCIGNGAHAQPGQEQPKESSLVSPGANAAIGAGVVPG